MLLSNLVGNATRSKIQDELENAQEVQDQLRLYGYVYGDPDAPLPLKQAASRHSLGLVEKHGGKEGKAALPQLTQMFDQVNQMQQLQQLAGRQVKANLLGNVLRQNLVQPPGNAPPASAGEPAPAAGDRMPLFPGDPGRPTLRRADQPVVIPPVPGAVGAPMAFSLRRLAGLPEPTTVPQAGPPSVTAARMEGVPEPQSAATIHGWEVPEAPVEAPGPAKPSRLAPSAEARAAQVPPELRRKPGFWHRLGDIAGTAAGMLGFAPPQLIQHFQADRIKGALARGEISPEEAKWQMRSVDLYGRPGVEPEQEKERKQLEFVKRQLDQIPGLSDQEKRDALVNVITGYKAPTQQLARTPMVVYESDGTKHNWTIDRAGQRYDEQNQPVTLGPGWSEYKVGTQKQAPDEMSGTLRTLYQSYLASGYSPAAAKKMAGDAYRANFAAGWEKKQLDIAVERELAKISGVPGVAEVSPAPPSAAGVPAQAPAVSAPSAAPQAPPSGAAAAPAARPPGGWSPAWQITAPPAPPAADTKAPVPAKGQAVLSQVDAAAMDEVMSRALGLIPGTRGGDRLAQLRYARGLQIWKQQTGMSVTELFASVSLKKDQAKALNTAVQRTAGVKTLQELLAKFGEVLIEARSKVDSTGVPVFNRWLQAGMRSMAGDPDVSALDTAVNAVTRTYAQLLSGGYTSTAMPHVSSADDAKKTLAGYMENGQIGAVVRQMGVEASADQEIQTRRQRELWDEMAAPLGPPGGGGPGGGAGGGAQPSAAPSKNADDYLRKLGIRK